MPPVSGKVRVLNFIRKGEKPNAEVAKIYGKNESSVWENVKKEKETGASCTAAPQIPKVTTQGVPRA